MLRQLTQMRKDFVYPSMFCICLSNKTVGASLQKKISFLLKTQKQCCNCTGCPLFPQGISPLFQFLSLLKCISSRTAEIAFYLGSIFNVLVNWWVLTCCQEGTVDVNRLSKAEVWTPNPSICANADRMWQTNSEKERERERQLQKKMERVGGWSWSSKK